MAIKIIPHTFKEYGPICDITGEVEFGIVRIETGNDFGARYVECRRYRNGVVEVITRDDGTPYWVH